MGSSSSTQRQSQLDVEKHPTEPKRPRTHFEEYSLAVPDEVTTDPFETKYLAFDHWDHIYVAPNRDGSHFVCFVPRTTTRSPSMEDHEREGLKYLTHWRLVHELLFGITRRSDEHSLSIAREHPRIMRYLGDFPFGFYLEHILPGQQTWLKTPASELPVTTPSAEDCVILRLYYRWALQALSALMFMHSRGIYIDNFDSTSVYVRSDLSVAVTGFGVAYVERPSTINLSGIEKGEKGEWNQYVNFGERNKEGNDDDSEGEDEDPYVPYEPPIWRGHESIRPNWDMPTPGPRTDVFDWAKWIWRLMTNDSSTSPPPNPHEPLVSMELETKPAWCNTFDDNMQWDKARYEGRRFQRLEDKRLGEVLYKAFTEEYVDAAMAMDALRAAIDAQGVEIIGQDEIAPEEGSGKAWEEVFELVRSEEYPKAISVKFRD